MEKDQSIRSILLVISIVLTVMVVSIASITVFNEELPSKVAFWMNSVNYILVLAFVFTCIRRYGYLGNRSRLRQTVFFSSLVGIVLIASAILINFS